MRPEIKRHIRKIQRRIRPMHRPMMVRAQQRQVAQRILRQQPRPP